MRYIVAFDGGGTKTRVVLGDKVGNILVDIIGKGCTKTNAGSEYLESVLKELYETVLNKAHLCVEDIEIVYLGLTGADMPSDFERLNKACFKVFNNTKFLVVNDAWIIMRSGLKEPWGAVCISGTGTNAGAINKEGKVAILRSLGFTLGIYGGGIDIAREGLHFAFRADELTNEETVLQTKIPKLFGLKNMDEVVSLFYPKNIVDRIKLGEITKLVFESALEGDKVCQDILIKVGDTLGKQTAGVIKQVKMENEYVPVVVGGSVFSGVSPLLIDQLILSLHKCVPHAYIVKPKYPPVYGGYLGALDELGIKQSSEIEDNLKISIEVI